jgi:CRISPR system Cascade subunit CasA
VNFNLVDEPFIPCLLQDGTRREFNLLEALLRAQEIRELRDESPVVTIALHRLLLAILYRNFGPANLPAWKRLWQAGHFDPATLTTYFEKWRDRFDLFDDEHPFYQTGGMTSEKPLPIAALLDERSCNNNATLFDHSTNECGPGIKPAMAARGLVARQGFALGLGVSPDVTIRGKVVKTGNRKDGPLARGLLVLVRGDNLFQTLLCNLTQYTASQTDLPIWEHTDPESLVGQARVEGRVDLYSFQCRRLRLVLPREEGQPDITRVYFAQGRALHPDERDPMKPYRRDEKRGWLEFGVSEEKAIWRDSSALLELASDADQPFAALNWVAQAASHGIIPRHTTYSLETFAVGTQPGKATSIILWRHDRMPLPLAYLGDRNLVAALKAALSIAEEMARALRSAAWLTGCVALAPDSTRKADTDRVRAFVDALAPERLYWSRLEVRFRSFLLDLPGDGSQAHRSRQIEEWTLIVLRKVALDAFAERVGQLDTSARLLRALAVGQRHLGAELVRIARKHNITSTSKESAHA